MPRHPARLALACKVPISPASFHHTFETPPAPSQTWSNLYQTSYKMNLSLTDPFTLAQDYPDTVTNFLRSGHAGVARFNRTGDYLASGRVDGVVVIFDIETNGIARKLKGHTRQVQSLSWSGCGRYLMSSGLDWKVILWDLEDGSMLRSVRFETPVYIAELNPIDHFKFAVALYDDQPLLIDVTEIRPKRFCLPTIPKRTQYEESEPINEKQAALDAKASTTVVVWTPSGDHIISGTNKGWLNIIDVYTRTIVYSTKVCTGAVVFCRLANSGRLVVLNAQDRVIRTMHLPDLSAPDLDPDTIDMEVEHKFQDVVNRLSWNHVAFSSTGEYVTASTYNNHDIYIWERSHGSLVKILEGPKEEHGVVEWHPHRPLIAACGLETGRIHIWSNIPQQRWSALAPDFVEVEENVEYVEHEDEFDIHPQEEIHKRRLDAEDEEVDVLTVEPGKGVMVEEEDGFRMPVDLGFIDSESEEEFVAVGRGEMRRKSPTGGDYGGDFEMGGTGGEEGGKKKSKSRRR